MHSTSISFLLVLAARSLTASRVSVIVHCRLVQTGRPPQRRLQRLHHPLTHDAPSPSHGLRHCASSSLCHRSVKPTVDRLRISHTTRPPYHAHVHVHAHAAPRLTLALCCAVMCCADDPVHRRRHVGSPPSGPVLWLLRSGMAWSVSPSGTFLYWPYGPSLTSHLVPSHAHTLLVCPRIPRRRRSKVGGAGGRVSAGPSIVATNNPRRLRFSHANARKGVARGARQE